jgi:pimeloyl-ACP methyl ester carboxylesterase
MDRQRNADREREGAGALSRGFPSRRPGLTRGMAFTLAMLQARRNGADDLEKIRAAVLAINSADDERNPPETGIMDRELKRIKNARLFLIPASEDTRGHLTTGFAKFWKNEAADFLATVPRQAGER